MVRVLIVPELDKPSADTPTVNAPSDGSGVQPRSELSKQLEPRSQTERCAVDHEARINQSCRDNFQEHVVPGKNLLLTESIQALTSCFDRKRARSRKLQSKASSSGQSRVALTQVTVDLKFNTGQMKYSGN